MNRQFPALFFLLITFGLFVAQQTRAQAIYDGIISISGATTTNSQVFKTNNMTANLGAIIVPHGDLIGSTNTVSGRIRISLDKTNYVNYGSAYTPSTTNSRSDRIADQANTIPLYFRFEITTTTNATLAPTTAY